MGRTGDFESPNPGSSPGVSAKFIPGSSNGRTAPSEGAYGGSNPSLGALDKGRRSDMSKHNNKQKDRLLGMPHGTANNRLKKSIIYDLARQLGKLECFRCKEIIYKIDELSIEHIHAWQSSPDPKAAFFDLSNVAFSHLSCNCAAAARPSRKYYTEQERKDADLRLNRDGHRRNYDIAKRHKKWINKGQ